VTRSLAVAVLLTVALGSGALAAPPELAFVDGSGHRRATFTAALLDERAVTVAGFDPYYGRDKRWRAVALAPLLARAFAGIDLGRADVLLRAADGYAVPISARRLLEDGAFVAIADLDRPGWEPIGPQRAHPGPFYLVWRPSRRDLVTHPRPWALASIEIIDVASAYPHVAPTGVADDAPAMRGFRLFRERCIRCHAINREGGRVGPDLNVPRSIVEYRDEAQLRAYIRNPLAFRYGAMPPNLDLSETQLDELLAFFRHKRGEKHDPDAAGSAAGRH
jgi:mono/diheme cytochrome c family protein